LGSNPWKPRANAHVRERSRAPNVMRTGLVHATQRSACEDPGKRYAQSRSEPNPQQAQGLEPAAASALSRNTATTTKQTSLPVARALQSAGGPQDPGAGCPRGSRRSCKSLDTPAVFGFPSRPVFARLRAVAAAAWLAIDADVVVTRGEDRGIGIRPLAASWPPDRRTADPNGAADTFPTFGPGLLASRVVRARGIASRGTSA
jgi:hypothetical protein